MNIILAGKPGAGKGTQSRLLTQRHNFTYIATGDIIRAEMKAQTPLGLEMKKLVQQGKFVDDATILKLIGNKLDEHENVLLDGYPRNLSQAQELDKHKHIDACVFLDITDEEAITRLSTRWMVNCKGEQISFPDQKSAEEFAQKNGCEVFHRKDDNPEIAKERLTVYHEQTQPILDHYKQQGKLIIIPGQEQIEATAKLVETQIQKIKKKA